MSVLRPWCAAECSAFSNALSAHPVQPVTRYGRMDAELLLPSRRQLHILPEAEFIPEFPNCWYIHVAIWMMRSVPFMQLRKTFKVPDILLFEVASYLV